MAAYCVERRAAGAPWSELSAELSVGETQLQKWTGSKRGSKLQPVRVISAQAATSGLCLELPGTARLTGLSVADVAALLRVLHNALQSFYPSVWRHYMKASAKLTIVMNVVARSQHRGNRPRQSPRQTHAAPWTVDEGTIAALRPRRDAQGKHNLAERDDAARYFATLREFFENLDKTKK